jgi:Putative Se/S carrier protein-like
MDGLITFFASHYALRAEAVLKRGGLHAKLIAGPRDLSPNCGVALRFEYGARERALGLLDAHRVQVDGVHRFVPRTDGWSREAAGWRP